MLKVRPRTVRGKSRVMLLFQQSASCEDVLTGLLHATKLREQIHLYEAGEHPLSEENLTTASHKLVISSLQWSRMHRVHFISELRKGLWNTEHLFLENNRVRLQVFN